MKEFIIVLFVISISTVCSLIIKGYAIESIILQSLAIGSIIAWQGERYKNK